METYFLARLLGLTLIIVYGSILINQKHYQDVIKDSGSQPLFSMLWGFISLVYGLVVVILHNFWEFDWRILITLIGWFLLIVGAIRLVIPEQVQQWTKSVSKAKTFTFMNTAAVILLVVGIFLTYMGFFSR